RKRPSWVISTQHGAVWWSANGEAPIELSVPSPATLNAETVPASGPPWAFETNSWLESVGRNSLPNGPGPCAGNGEPGAAVGRPSSPTAKPSMSDAPTRPPTKIAPSPLNRMSPGDEPFGNETVESGSGRRRPLGSSVKPV